jgi:hypothetical protein
MSAVQVRFFVGIFIVSMYGIRRDHPLDVDNGDGKSWYRSQVFHFFRLVSVGKAKGFEDEFSDNSDLLKMVRRVFLARNNLT